MPVSVTVTVAVAVAETVTVSGSLTAANPPSPQRPATGDTKNSGPSRDAELDTGRGAEYGSDYREIISKRDNVS